MTTTTDLPTSTAPEPHPSARHESASAAGAGYLTTAATTARRSVLKFFRTPQLLLMGTVQGALFLFMFRYVFGGAISTGGAISYVDFLVPGFIVTVILWTGMSSAAGVAEDAATGVFDRLRSLPIPRSAVMLGRALADATLVTWGLLITSVLGFALGFRAHGSIGAVIGGFALTIAAGFAFTWVFIYIGLISGNAQAAQGMSMLVIPFSFVSSANVPIRSMPGWMQPFAANQPVSVIINAVRSLMQGGTHVVGIPHTTTYWIVLSIVWCVGIMIVFGTLTTIRFSRTK
ncbi:MAG TPA: ABC transporter permease [Ilumatobacteraceae bacterium]